METSAQPPENSSGPPARDTPGELSPKELQVFVCYIMAWPHWRIALQTGLSESAVAQIIGRPRFKAAVAQATQSVVRDATKIATRLAELAPEALERVAYLMQHAKSEQVQQRSAFDILDRAGHKPIERQERHNTYEIPKEDLDLINETLHQTHEMRRASDGSYEPAGEASSPHSMQDVFSVFDRPKDGPPRSADNTKNLYQL